jgi:hypothetical protein
LRSNAAEWKAARPKIFMELRHNDLCAYDKRRDPRVKLTKNEFEAFLADVGNKNSAVWACNTVFRALTQALDFDFCPVSVAKLSTAGGHFLPGCFIVGNNNSFDMSSSSRTLAWVPR